MKQLKHIFGQIQSIRLVLLLGFLCLLPLGYSYGQEPTVTLTQHQYETLQENLTTLENTIDNQLNTINELETQLNAAKLSTSESNKQLMEASTLIVEQRKQRISLEKAEIYLTQQKEIIKKAQRSQQRAKLINVLLGATVVYLAVK